MKDKFVVYDVETLINLFTACFYDCTTKKRREFKLFDDIEEFILFIKFLKSLHKNDYILVGFNCLHFDSQILEFIIRNADEWLRKKRTPQQIVRYIYDEAQRVIKLEPGERFEGTIPEWKLTIKHIDLFKQKHYDGKAKMGTSLKWLQFTMRRGNIQEMPIEHNQLLDKSHIPDVLSYNWNDVDSTDDFFGKIRFETELRQTLSDKFGKNLLNASEPRIAKVIFAKFLCEDMGIDENQLKEMRTWRKQVRLNEVIFKYIKFQTPELQAVLNKVKGVTVIPNNAEFEHIFNYGGIETVMALGGIHACCKPGVYEADKYWTIEDIDVTSFYPNLAIENNIRPKHLGEAFNRVYKMIFDERQKIPKKDPVNYVYKIILNSAYGLSKEQNSYLYDPFFTYSITINGQLSILMLVEQLVLRVSGLKIYQENTDGVTIGYDTKYRSLVADICEEWCKITSLALEHAFYKKMVIRDVNNYMAIKESFDWNDYYNNYVLEGKRKEYSAIKHKGTFEIEMDWHKNPSFLIINKAVEAYFFGNIPYRDFIMNHEDIFDFCAGVKKKHDFDLNLHLLRDDSAKLLEYETTKQALEENGYYETQAGWWRHKDWQGELAVVTEAEAYAQLRHKFSNVSHKQYPQQKVTRFYVSRDGGLMTKDFHSGKKIGSRVSVLADWKVTPVNVITDTNAHNYPNLNRNYYIKETEKLIFSVQTDKNQLKLF